MSRLLRENVTKKIILESQNGGGDTQGGNHQGKGDVLTSKET